MQRARARPEAGEGRPLGLVSSPSPASAAVWAPKPQQGTPPRPPPLPPPRTPQAMLPPRFSEASALRHPVPTGLGSWEQGPVLMPATKPLYLLMRLPACQPKLQQLSRLQPPRRTKGRLVCPLRRHRP